MLLVGCIVVSGVIGGCATEKKASTPPSKAVFVPMVTNEMIAGSELKIEWQNKLPMGKNEKLESVKLIGKRVYGLSSRNYLVSLKAENGSVLFSRNISAPGLPVRGLSVYKNKLLYCTIGNRLVEFNVDYGNEISSMDLDFTVVSPVVRNDSYYYLAGSDRRIHVLDADDRVHVFEAAADNDSVIISVMADSEKVIFGTGAGDIIAMEPDKPKILWSFKAADGIAGEVVRRGEALVAASKDTNVYKVNVSNGELVWKFQLEGIPDRAPEVSDTMVYQYVRDKGLTAIDLKTGKKVWNLPEGTALLSESGERAYILTRQRDMAVMDNKKAKMVKAIGLDGVSVYVRNSDSPEIYAGDSSGRLTCLKPSR